MWRRAGRPPSYLMTREAVSKLFDTISPRYGDREGGYLRIIHGGFRQGDGGDIAFVELLGSEKTLDEKRQKRAELRAKRAEETRKAMESAEAETTTGRRRGTRRRREERVAARSALGTPNQSASVSGCAFSLRAAHR